MNTILQSSALHKSFGKLDVLRDVSFELAENETAVLLGTNGAGKSTLLRLLLGLDSPSSGGVRLFGLDPMKRGRVAREQIGYVPDHPDVYDWMTAQELFKFLKPAYPTWCDERASRFAEALGFPLKTSFKSLSRGEAAKVMLAAALAPSPKLIVLDEAFARLSPPVREQVLEFFVREAPLEGGAALVATHDLDVATRLADRVLMLEDGKLTEVDDLHATQGESVPTRLRSLYNSHNQEALAG